VGPGLAPGGRREVVPRACVRVSARASVRACVRVSDGESVIVRFVPPVILNLSGIFPKFLNDRFNLERRRAFVVCGCDEASTDLFSNSPNFPPCKQASKLFETLACLLASTVRRDRCVSF
jgi:hypothetical protein